MPYPAHAELQPLLPIRFHPERKWPGVACSRTRKPRRSGAFVSGRYWARTSDLLLVETVRRSAGYCAPLRATALRCGLRPGGPPRLRSAAAVALRCFQQASKPRFHVGPAAGCALGALDLLHGVRASSRSGRRTARRAVWIGGRGTPQGMPDGLGKCNRTVSYPPRGRHIRTPLRRAGDDGSKAEPGQRLTLVDAPWPDAVQQLCAADGVL